MTHKERAIRNKTIFDFVSETKDIDKTLKIFNIDVKALRYIVSIYNTSIRNIKSTKNKSETESKIEKRLELINDFYVKEKGYAKLENYLLSPDGLNVFKVRKDFTLKLVKISTFEDCFAKKKYTYKRISFNCKGEYLHRAMYMAFHGDIPKGMHVDHIDNDRMNNHYANLQLLSPMENCRKTMLNNIKTNKITAEMRKNNHKSTAKSVKCIQTGKIYSSIKIAEEETGINRRSISMVSRGLQKTAGGGYTFEFVKKGNK